MRQLLLCARHATIWLILLLFTGYTNSSVAQSAGDYRTKKSGYWASTDNIWETYNGSAWVDVEGNDYPTNKNGTITIQHAVTIQITSQLTIDQVVVTSSGSLTISGDVYLKDGLGDDLVSDGQIILNKGISFKGNATLVNNGPFGNISFAKNCFFNGVGQFVNNSYMHVNANLHFPVDLIFNNSGSIDGSGGINIKSTLNHTGGDIRVPLTIANGAIYNLQVPSFYQLYMSDVTNNGTMNLESGSLYFLPNTIFTNKKKVNIAEGGLTTDEHDRASLNNSSTGIIEITNKSSNVGIGLDITNNGSFVIDSTSLTTSGSFNNMHVINLKNGTYINEGILFLNSSEPFKGSGEFLNDDRSTVIIDSVYTFPGKITVVNGGYLQGNGHLYIEGSFSLGGEEGFCRVPLTINKQATAEFLLAQLYAPVVNNGTVHFYSNNAIDSTTFTNNGLISTSGPYAVINSYSKTGSFINNGQIQVTQTYDPVVFNFYLPFTNTPNGSLEGNAGYSFPDTLINKGVISPGADTGHQLVFTQNPFRNTSTLNLDFGVTGNGETRADNIWVDKGNIILGGTLNLYQVSDSIAPGDYTIVDGHGLVTGTFKATHKPTGWKVNYGKHGVTVHVPPSTLTAKPLPVTTGVQAEDAKADLTKGKTVVVSPNPVRNALYIRGLDASADNALSILSADGKLVKSSVTKGPQYSWDIGHLAKGIYYLVIRSKEETQTVKFIKE